MSNNLSAIQADIERSIETKKKLLTQAVQIEKIAAALLAVVRSGGTIYSCGNGGSACDSMHLNEELVARYLRDRPGIRAHHLIDSPLLTCWSNDVGFDGVFERQVQTFIKKEDALVVFSTSGNSTNILRALDAAKAAGATTIALLGRDGGKAAGLAAHQLIVESKETARIQECHILVVHILCEYLETKLFPDAA